MSTTTSTQKPVLSIEGRRVIITGGATGIGYGVAQALVEYGALVLITGRREEKVNSAVVALNAVAANGGRAIGIVADVTKRVDNERTVATAVREFGGIDVLFNNAGTGSFKPIAAVDEEELRAVLDVNVVGLYLLTQAALPELKKSTAGRIFSTSSIAAVRGLAYGTAYSATKGAVSAFGRSLAIELASDDSTRHITVNTISPGPFESELFDTVPAEMRAALIASHPQKRAGVARPEIGGILVALISGAGAYTTGQEIVIDGGQTTRA